MGHAWKIGENEIGVVVEIPVVSGSAPAPNPVSNPIDSGLHAQIRALKQQLEELNLRMTGK